MDLFSKSFVKFELSFHEMKRGIHFLYTACQFAELTAPTDGVS